MKTDVCSLTEKLQEWYRSSHRELPWRKTKNPYKIWISEVILQQTRVEQGLPYYHQFIRQFPDVKSLASAPLHQVMKQWQGLGYYSRARNLHDASKQIVNEFRGKFPSGFDELLSLKGVGYYTAAAIASIAFNKPHAVVDGNVMRVLARLFAIDLPVNSTAGIQFFREKAHTILDKKNPSTHNQALMELGALICKPVNPLCNECVIKNYCRAYQTGTVNRFPVKEKKPKPKKLFLHYLVVVKKNEFLLHQRISKGIWKNLFEFPVLESKTKKEWSHAELSSKLHQIGIPDFKIEHHPDEISHVLTHRYILARFSVIKAKRFDRKKITASGFQIVKQHNLKNYPVHRLMEKIIARVLL
jgi:A/G-specific adenine glycosylase